MASKLSHSPVDEKRELQKQLGCMNGIFQRFDRRYFLGQQRATVRNHKRLSPPPDQSGNNKMELKDAAEKTMEKDPKKLAKEKQRVSVESSRTSFSSTCPSSTEPPSSSKSIFPEASSPIISIEQPSHIKPLNLRDLVKDSMYREARSVSVKTMKHIDSPRPVVQQQKSLHPPRGYNLPEASWSYNEEKDAPRFSYDGRVSQSKLKSSVKLKELPRLSLDSREKSRKNFLRDTQTRQAASGQIMNVDQEPGSNKRPSGLVAKLMGLDALPEPSTDNDLVITSATLRMGEEVKKSQISGSPRVSYTEPRMGIASTATKQPAKSRLPLEPAPWRQEGARRQLQKPALKTKESSTRTPHGYPSVYGEIEKRLTELEFKKSGKDLRALKQILEAMEKTRKRLEDTEQSLDLDSKSSKCSSDYGSWDQHNHPVSVSPSIKGNSPPKRGQFPVMVKPAKFIGKPMISDAKEISGLQKLRTKTFAYEGSSRLGDPSRAPLPSPEKKTSIRILGPSLSPKVPENITGDRLTSSRKTSGSGSPRMQQKIQGMEQQSIPSNVSDFSKGRKQSNKKPMRSEGTTKTMKSKSTNIQHTNNQLHGFSREARNLSQQSDTVSMQSESNSSLASQNDTEVTSRDWTCKISNYAARLTEDGLMAQLATATLEQPSPVSVLDAAFYGEESPSPVKKVSNAFREYETLTCEDAEWNQEASTNSWSQFNHDKLENIRQLVDCITLLNSTPKEATTNATALFHENRHPDHLYITEIFLASGFLENLGSNTSAIRLHSSGHLIDPNLFHVLEKNKEYTELASYEHQEKSVGSKSSDKNRRKLIFDTANEILVRKLAFTGSNKMRKSLSGEKLLEEVWSEINNLQANSDNNMDDEYDELISIIREDVNQKSADWEGHSNELPGMVLDIERLIFKDLISEFVSGGVAGSQLHQSARPCKQLFSL